MDLINNVKNMITGEKLIKSGDSILIALSGGPDSTALLHLLVGLREAYKLSLRAVYVNHQLRKKAAQAEEEFCQKLCDKYDIALDIATADIKQLAKDKGQSIEQAAREFRYELFETLAIKNSHNRIAVGHHLNDQAETILFRIIRGTGLDGLKGMAPKRGKIIRPLLAVSKNEILEYLKANRLAYCLDQSNDSIKMSRNYIRNQLLPDIRKQLNPQIDKALIRLGKVAQIDLDLLDKLAEKAVKTCVKQTPGGKFELVLSKLCGYDGAVQRRLLRHCLRELVSSNQAPDREVIERLMALVRLEGDSADNSRKISLRGSLIAKTEAGKLILYARAKLKFKQSLESGKKCKLLLPRLTFSDRLVDGSIKDIIKAAHSQRISVDWEAVSPPLVVRSIKSGDRFSPLGMSGSKKISDFLIDQKVPEHKRDEIALVCDRKGIIWVAGYQIEDRVKLTPETRKVLFLEFSQRKKRKKG